jgi:hypothetical protein
MNADDAVVMRALDGPLKGEYLVSFDAEAGNGQGFVLSTPDLQKARRFTFREAWETLGTEPRSKPKRPDGKPNRPLTATTWQILPVEGAD